jgi:hypothetical protein
VGAGDLDHPLVARVEHLDAAAKLEGVRPP